MLNDEVIRIFENMTAQELQIALSEIKNVRKIGSKHSVCKSFKDAATEALKRVGCPTSSITLVLNDPVEAIYLICDITLGNYKTTKGGGIKRSNSIIVDKDAYAALFARIAELVIEHAKSCANIQKE